VVDTAHRQEQVPGSGQEDEDGSDGGGGAESWAERHGDPVARDEHKPDEREDVERKNEVLAIKPGSSGNLGSPRE
jgi:hypothetical protein